MDGNPHAGPDTVREALGRGRALALGRYRGEFGAFAAGSG